MAAPRLPELVRSGEELRAWRRDLGVSQARLAQALGVSSRAVEGYERGEWPLPALLPWALLGVRKPLRSRLLYEARCRRRNRVRRTRYAKEKKRAEREARELERTRLRAEQEAERDRKRGERRLRAEMRAAVRAAREEQEAKVVAGFLLGERMTGRRSDRLRSSPRVEELARQRLERLEESALESERQSRAYDPLDPTRV